jgi:hypothetical protein
VKVPVAKAAYLQRQREAFTGSAQVRERSTKDLKRSWSRSRLNTNPVPPRQVEVVEDELDTFTPDWEAQEAATSAISPASPPSGVSTTQAIATPPKARPPPHISQIIAIVNPPTPPRLRVAVDWHNTLQFENRARGETSHIPPANLEALRRLKRHHEVYIYSWAPSRDRASEVEYEYRYFGVSDILGGSAYLKTGDQIEARTTYTDRNGRKWLGKADLCKRDGINVLIDDNIDVGLEARRADLNFIGINNWWMVDKGYSHHFGVRNFAEAVDLIFEDPDRWF